MDTNRYASVDVFKVQEEAVNILNALEKKDWTQGEVELLPKYLKKYIIHNSERTRKSKPFAVHKSYLK